MPFRSQQQARWAHATDQPFARRWDKQTDFAKLPKRVKRIRSRMGLKGCTCKAAPAAAPTAAKPGAGQPGELLEPGVRRIRGNLCNVHGKYGPCDAAAAKKKPKGGKGRAPKKAPKPKQTPEQRQTARDEQKRTNAADVAQRMADTDMGLAPGGSAALLAMRAGTPPSAQAGEQLAKLGLTEQAADGSFRMTPTGRSVVSAMEAGDYQRAVDTISRGTDTATARTGRQIAAAQRRQDVAARRAASEAKRQAAQQERAARLAKRGSSGDKKKPEAQAKPAAPAKRAARMAKRRGGGAAGGVGASVGGSAPKKPVEPKPEKPTPAQRQADNRASVRDAMAQADQGLAPGGFDNLIALGGGTEPDDIGAQGLISMGMAERGTDGTLRLTSAGRQAIAAANRGDAKAAIDVISRASEPMKTKEPRGKATSGDVHNGGCAGEVSRQLFVADILRNKAHDQTDAYRRDVVVRVGEAESLRSPLRPLPDQVVDVDHSSPTSIAQESFTVYKDATGADRWVSVSSTAYRDRDKEIVSTKALTGAVALADASGLRGPLRFWHVPGVELGDCDYQATAQDGRFLIESGTFRSPALAAAVKSHADDYQLSIGFTHPPDEPDSTGVFSHIAIFERSLVPRGRASNPLTQLTLVTKESRMLTTEKQAELTRLLDGNGELLAGLLASIATTDKAAQDGGIAYKDAPDLRALIRAELADLLSETTEKAAPPPFAEAPEEEAKADMEGMEEDMAEGGVEEPGEENMLTGAEITAIAQQTAQVLLDALMPHLGIGAKMDEVKSMLGGMAGSYAKKDAELAEVKETLATVRAQVADLSGNQPRIMAGGYRASQSSTTITTDERLKDAQPSADPRMAAFSDFLGELGLTQSAQPGV